MFALLADFVVPTSNLLAIVVLILDIIALISVIAGRGSIAHKLIWTLLVLALPLIGMILYYLIGQSRADADVI